MRVVIKGIDITPLVAPGGNMGDPGKTWIDPGSIPVLNDDAGKIHMIQVQLLADGEGIKFHHSSRRGACPTHRSSFTTAFESWWDGQ